MSMSVITLAKFVGTTLLYLIIGVVSMAIVMVILINTKFGKKIVKKLMKGDEK